MILLNSIFKYSLASCPAADCFGDTKLVFPFGVCIGASCYVMLCYDLLIFVLNFILNQTA